MLRRWFLIAAFSTLFCSLGLALYAVLSAPPSLEEVREHLIGRRYTAAAKSAEERLAVPDLKEEEVAELRFLLAHARLLDGDAAGARQALDVLIERQPSSTWTSKARFELADLDRDQGRHVEAARIFRERVAHLIAPERKGEVAAIYKRFAVEAMAKEPPDLARARAFYDLAAELGLPRADDLEVRFAAAEIAERQGDHGSARERFAALRKEYGDGAEGRLLFHLAVAELAYGQAVPARAHFEDLLRLFPESEHRPAALHGIATSFGFPTPPSEGALERGATLARRLIAAHPEHELAAKAAFDLGEAYFHLERYAEASAAWEDYLARYGTRDEDEAGIARVMIGECAEKEQRYAEAIAAWRVFLTEHPFHPEGPEVQQLIATAELARAARMAKEKRYDEARAAYEEWLMRYPLDPRAAAVLAGIGTVESMRARYDAAITQWERVASKYPNSEAASESLFHAAETLETELKKLDAAVAMYRRCNFGSYHPLAAERLAALEEATLSLRATRVYRTNEKLEISLSTRNIESVRLRIYAIDLSNYFAATRSIRGVENLDIEIIQPTRTLEFRPAAYERYREIVSPLDLEVEGPGAWVVKVDNGKVEATALALRSDIELITRSTKQDLVVYAENVVAQAPAAGVKLMIADGTRLLFEGETDARGLFYHQDPKLEAAANLAVFATTAAGSAFSGLKLGSTIASQSKLTPRGYLFTDRAVYEPGERVEAQAFVRLVKDGAFTIDPAEPWSLDWFGPNGAVLASSTATPSEFGALRTSLELGSTAALGSYSLRVRRGEQGPTFQRQFEVRRVDRKAIRVAIDLDQSVLYRGEVVKGVARASFFHGGPAPDRQITVSFSDGSQHEGRTDAQGAYAFEFKTVDLLEAQDLWVRATLNEEGVSSQSNLRLAVNALELELSSLRDIYTVGESFSVILKAHDPLGVAAETAGELAIYRLMEENGVRSERLETKREWRTDAKGRSEMSLLLHQGGPYRLRSTATDRFGNRVHAALDLFISGEEDAVKLRILSARDTLIAGVAEPVRILSRIQATRVLVTRIGDGIRSYEVRDLPQGESTWSLEIGAGDAPNFGFSIAAIEGTKLHEATKLFRVDQELEVRIEPAATSATPGTAASARVSVKGAGQQPVDAEVVVAIIDEAFLALYPDPTPPLANFFTGTRAWESSVGSSCAFESIGTPRAVAQGLIAEEARRIELLRRAASGPSTPSGPATPGSPKPSPPLADRAARDQRGLEELGKNVVPELNARVFSSGGFGERGKAKDENGVAEFAPDTSADEFFLGIVNKRFDRSDSGVESSAAASPEPELRRDFRATAWFGSVVVRASEGSAEMRFTWPDSTTSWQWTARALTRDAAGGDATTTSIVKLPLEVQLDLPRQLVEGDRARVRANVRNTSGATLQARAELTAAGAIEATASEAFELIDGGEATVALDLNAARTGDAELRGAVRSEAAADAAVRRIEVRPAAVQVQAQVAGIARDDVHFDLELDPELKAFDLKLRVDLERAGTQALIEMALHGGGAAFEARGCPPVDLLSRAIARASAALDALRSAEQGAGVAPQLIDRLRSEAGSVVARLGAVQRSDGGFDWIGVGGALRAGAGVPNSDSVITARAHAVLVRAAAQGFAGAPDYLTKSRAYLEGVLKSSNDETLQARILASLALEGRAEFAAINRLLRRREALGGAGLGFLALACVRQDREELAREVWNLVQPLLRRDASGAWLASGAESAPGDDAVEATAALLRAIYAFDAREILAAELARFLEARRRGASFGGDAASELATHALFARSDSTAASGDRFTVEVLLQDESIGNWEVPSEEKFFALTRKANLAAGKQKVTLRFRGVGSFRYVASLEGLTKNTKRVSEVGRLGVISRNVRPAAPRSAGRVLPEGFSVVDTPQDTWINKTDRVHRGGTVRVDTSFRSQKPGEYLVLEDPLPAGAELEPGSITGNIAHWELAPGRLLFFFAPGQLASAVSYRLLGRFEGRYIHLPARVWSYVDPSWLIATQASEFRVLSADEANDVAYRPTPDELYHRGERLFAAGEREAASELLEHLLTAFPLRRDPLRETLRMVFLAALDRGASDRIVEHFESLKDRYPELTIRFEQMLQVGDAYVSLSEYERATDVFRGIAEASFLREMGVAGTLEEQGRFLESLAFVQRLLLEYPSLGVVESTSARLPQWLQARTGTQVLDAEGKPIAPRDLLARAIELARAHLVLAPAGPLADEVAFGMVSAHLEREEYVDVLARSELFSSLFDRSAYLDDFLYAEGYADFALGHAERALGVLDRVATEKFPDGRGAKVEGSHRDLAIWMRGQIHHAAGRLAQAIAAYTEVKTKFTDASQAIAQLERKELHVPEVTRVAPGAGANLEIKTRNLQSVELRVYPVDLVRLYLLQRSLDDMTRVQLAGIQPLHQRRIDVTDQAPFVECKTMVELPIEKLGAYLVVVRSEELSAAGMLIRTSLELDVWNEPESGLVRVAVREVGGEPLARAHVKVVGTQSGNIQGADTDLRGIASFDGVPGRATLIVQSGEQVAFWRAPKELAPRSSGNRRDRQQEQQFQEEATRGFFDSNRLLNESGGQQLEKLLRSRQQGVEVYRVRK